MKVRPGLIVQRSGFNGITDELGREDQIKAYRAHLGM
jgi:hypothetical protein